MTAFPHEPIANFAARFDHLHTSTEAILCAREPFTVDAVIDVQVASDLTAVVYICGT